MVIITEVADVDQRLVVSIQKLMPQLTNSRAPSLSDLREMLASGTILLVAQNDSSDGEVVGVGTLAVFRTLSGLHAHIEDVVVDSGLRGQGIGEQLVRALIEAAKKVGVKGISLTCNPARVAANQLYRKLGFTEWKTNSYWYEL